MGPWPSVSRINNYHYKWRLMICRINSYSPRTFGEAIHYRVYVVMVVLDERWLFIVTSVGSQTTHRQKPLLQNWDIEIHILGPEIHILGPESHILDITISPKRSTYLPQLYVKINNQTGPILVHIYPIFNNNLHVKYRSNLIRTFWVKT